MTGAVPFTFIVLKVAARCNLDCSYCYEYQMGDDSWRRKPRVLSLDLASMVARRIREHCERWGVRRFGISLHGGEPLLAGIDHLDALLHLMRSEVGPGIELDVGMQTNAVLIDDEIASRLEAARCAVGVSLDGPPALNDRRRFNHVRRGSTASALRGLEALRRSGPRCFTGLLAVIDLDSDPLEVFDFLADLQPPSIDFLLPHANWERPPAGRRGLGDIPHARWMISIFDAWFSGRHRHISIRTFEEIIEHQLGGTGQLETMGLAPVTLLAVGTDGALEGVDTLKSAFPGAHELGMHIETHSLDDAREHCLVAERQAGLDALPQTCAWCPLVETCGGGYFPHRYLKGNGFRNPSVYCADLYELISHIRRVVVGSLRMAARGNE